MIFLYQQYFYAYDWAFWKDSFITENLILIGQILYDTYHLFFGRYDRWKRKSTSSASFCPCLSSSSGF